jgi:hypothetical protein
MVKGERNESKIINYSFSFFNVGFKTKIIEKRKIIKIKEEIFKQVVLN